MTFLEQTILIVFGVPFLFVAVPLVIEMILIKPFTANSNMPDRDMARPFPKEKR